MATFLPSSGQRFGAWVVLDEPVRVGVSCAACGRRRRMRVTDLERKPACKCGEGATRQDRGGASAHPVYRAWTSMRNRCGPTAPARVRRRYIDRGIKVCPEWATSFESFRDWAFSAGWAPGLELDRRDNDGDYTPSNCRWATPLDNKNNRETTRRVTAWGETKLLAAWMDDPRCTVPDYHLVYDRLYRATQPWAAERALTTPRRPAQNNRLVPHYVPGR